jgi:hypothetical protein
MAVQITPTVTALDAEAQASLFLSDHLPDRLSAGPPQLDADAYVWRVPVWLNYPVLGPLGQVGEITINAMSEEIVSHTPVDEMLAQAQSLYEQHRDAIEAAVL